VTRARLGADARWLELVRPSLAVPSVGRSNAYGHPSPQTIALLIRLGILPLRTDRDGTVTLESDGEHWWVVGRTMRPRGPPAGRGQAEPRHGERPRPVGRINVNTATQAELEALPGIGPVIAQRIMAGRPYRSVDDLDRVKGIGKKRLVEIRPLYQDANPPVERRRID
jgi:hypothetical protein